jgi:hypothetical protein
MPRTIRRALGPTLALTLTLLVATSAAMATGMASSTSSAASNSVGSSSDSIQRSSNSSSRGGGVAQGDYTIVAMGEADGRPGVTRITLQARDAANPDREFFLFVPAQAVGTAGLAQGDVVRARSRPYGTEFADARTHRAFFLALDDAWARELRTRALSL